jgi:hypothetical protein
LEINRFAANSEIINMVLEMGQASIVTPISRALHGLRNGGMDAASNSVREMLMYSMDGERSLLEVAKYFEEQLSRLDNMTADDAKRLGMSEDERALVRVALEKGLYQSARQLANFAIPLGSEMETINKSAKNMIDNIMVSNLDDRTKSIILKATNDVVAHGQNFLRNRAVMDAVHNFIEQNFLALVTRDRKRFTGEGLKTIEEFSKTARNDFNEKHRGLIDGFNAMMYGALNSLNQPLFTNSIAMPKQNEDGLNRVSDEENEDEETSSDVLIVDDSHSENSTKQKKYASIDYKI